MDSVRNQKSWQGYFEIIPNIRVATLISITESYESMIKASVGIRKQADTRLNLGSKVILRAKALEGLNLPPSELYYCQVLQVSRENGMDIHELSAPLPYEDPNKFDKTRLNIRVKTFRQETYTVQWADLTESGLKFVYNSSLTSASLGKNFEIFLTIHNKTHPFTCRVARITYNWWKFHHEVDAEFVNLTPAQQQLLDSLKGQYVLPVNAQCDAALIQELQDEGEGAEDRSLANVATVEELTIIPSDVEVPDISEINEFSQELDQTMAEALWDNIKISASVEDDKIKEPVDISHVTREVKTIVDPVTGRIRTS